jgi:hypothetical protein
LDHVVLVKYNVERRSEPTSIASLLGPAKEQRELKNSPLMPNPWGWAHMELPIDDLVALAIFRELLEIVVRQLGRNDGHGANVSTQRDD